MSSANASPLPFPYLKLHKGQKNISFSKLQKLSSVRYCNGTDYSIGTINDTPWLILKELKKRMTPVVGHQVAARRWVTR